MRILIWGEMKNGGPYDIFRQLDYKSVFTELQKEYSGTAPDPTTKKASPAPVETE